MTYKVHAHAVRALRIEKIEPLVVGNMVLAPDAGVRLSTTEGRHKYMAEVGAPMPAIGDWLVWDDELHTTFVVTADQFPELFTVAE